MNFSQKSFIALFGKLAGAILTMAISIFLARNLGVAGIGQYHLILSTQIVVITILAMGFGNASIYFINSKKIDRLILVSNLFQFFIIIALVLALVLGFALFNFENYFGYLNFLSILLFVTGAASLLMYNILMPVLYANLEIIKLQILQLSSNLFLLASILFFYLIDCFEINIVISITGISNIVLVAILLFYLRDDLHIKTKMDFILIKELFSFGVKLSATNFVFILSSNIVIFLMQHFLKNGFESVGLFSRASTIANIFLLIPTTLGPLLYSKWSGVSITKLHFEVEKASRILVSISIFCVLITILFGEYFLLLLYGKEFIGAKIVLIILSVTIVFSSIITILTNVFSSIGKPMITLKVFTVSLIITSILAFILIPSFGIEGAAFSVLIGVIYNGFALLYYSQKEINFSLFSSIFIRQNDIILLIKALNIS